MKIDVGKEFYHRLANRDKNMGDKKNTGVEFREKYLLKLDSEDAWKNDEQFIELDFTNVKKLGPSFANEVFAYFTKYAEPAKILKKIRLTGLTKTKIETINVELKTGYNGKS